MLSRVRMEIMQVNCIVRKICYVPAVMAVAFNLRHLASTTSTMDEAAAWAREGAPHLACVLADDQTSGRGRQGRVWQTFPGHSLACTYVLTENTGPHLPFLAAIAVVRALFLTVPTFQHSSTPTLQLKWPNDIMLNGQKLAGILVESLPTTDNHHPTTYLLGIGLNLTRSPAMMESFPGIPLADVVPPPPRLDLLNGITSCLSEVLALYGSSGWPALAGEYVRLSCTIGQTVRWVKPDGTELFGRAQGLTPEGTLELVDDAGGLHHIHSGDVIAQGRKH